MQQVALQGEAYKNEIVEIFGEDDSGIAAEDDSWGTPQVDGNDEGEPEGQAKDTEVASGKAKGSGGEAQAIEVNDKASENTRAKDTAQAKGTGTKTADGKTKGRGDEAQTIETDDKAIKESMKAIEENIKATKENMKATEEKLKAMEANKKVRDESSNAIEENNKVIEENDKAKAATQAKKEAAQANSASTKATSTRATGSNTKTDNKVVTAKGNGVAEVGGVKTQIEKTPFRPTNEGPNAEDMKELVTEMKDLTATH
jgi:hypothetical protein